MPLVWHYAHATTPAGPGSDTVIAEAVEVDPQHALTEAASLGDAAVCHLRVDDPAAAYDFTGLWRWYAIETDCPSGDHYAWDGYIGRQEISRGSGTEHEFMIGSGRRWDLEVVEDNAILGFRAITGADGDRPDETAAARLTWLLGSDYLSTVHDNGLVRYPTDALDAHDFRGQFARDVLNDLALKTGYLYFAFYDQPAGQISLFFDNPDSTSYASALQLSNVPADVDGTTTFAPEDDADLSRDPSRVAAGVYLPYSGGAVYQQNLATSYTFAYRDMVAPTASVKTSAKADALAAKLLADNAEQDERLTCRVLLPSAKLTAIKRGQVLRVKFSHLPGWGADGAYRWTRVVRKTFAPPENRSQTWYDVTLELSPVRPAPSGAFSRQSSGVAFSGIPVLPRPTTPGNLLLAVVVGQGNTTLFPADPRFQDDPPISGSPPIPPYPDHAGWTVLGTATTDCTGMNIGGPSATSGTLVAIAYRFVAPGEVTTHPVAASCEDAHDGTGIWLWEFPTSQAPTLVGASSNLRDLTNPGAFDLPSGSGFLLGALAFVQQDYGNQPISCTPRHGGTPVRVCSQANDPTLDSFHGWNPPFVYIGSQPSGGIVGADLQAISAYTSLNACGVVVALPAGAVGQGVPDIPYPANVSA